MDIVTLAAARKGSGGGASKEYVDEKVAALIDDTTAAQNKAYSSAKVEEKVAGEEITTTTTGSDLTLSTSAGNINAITVYGKSEVVDGAIKSAGEGYAVVDLGTLSWYKSDNGRMFSPAQNYIKKPADAQTLANILCPAYTTDTDSNVRQLVHNKAIAIGGDNAIYVYDSDYTDPATFKTAMSGVILAYKQATPTNNAIAIKTDNGTGINGTMATFTTGTPLRGIPDSDVRDVMTWDGSAGTVTKNCAKVRLADLTWDRTGITSLYQADVSDMYRVTTRDERNKHFLCSSYSPSTTLAIDAQMDDPSMLTHDTKIFIYDTRYSELNNFVASLGDAELVYELATPTTEQLTTAENASIAGLRTFEPQTHAQNNAGAEMTVEAYAGTANGKAVQELKQDVQSEISELKITQSDTLTLTTVGWNNNAQTVTYAHDTAKRNVIDVDPASVEEWASCGILATAETATSITFTCKTVPTNALNFKVTSMGV